MDATQPNVDPAGRGRAFQFQCLRCASILEARNSQCGMQARCPTCDATIVIPMIDPRSGLAMHHADPGDDGQNPTPVHAYAAAGEKAPGIVRRDDDSLVIRCPRCDRENPITADNCRDCGLPFTLEGAAPSVGTAQSPGVDTALILGAVAIPLSMCGGIGFIPGVLAIVMGWHSQNRRETSRRKVGWAGVILGLIACTVSLFRFIVD